MGILYVCGTPIGNLEDASIRLLKTLRKVDIIACEDTRHTIKLLNHFKIKNKLISYHEHSRKEKEDFLIEQLLAGRNIALVSDAGMPGICDPGEILIKRAIKDHIKIEIIPGPTALIAALAISGMDSTAFIFAGFLPVRSGKRRQSLQSFLTESRTVILYEAPHRLHEALIDIEAILGAERKLAVVRELTKKFEEVKHGKVNDLITHFANNPPRGEICLLIEGIEKSNKLPDISVISAEVKELISAGMDKKEALKIKAREYQIKKTVLYKYFVENND